MAILYQNGSISVDERFDRFGEKSYAINKINSVEVKRTEAVTKPFKAFAVAAAFFAVLAFSQELWGLFVFAALLGFFAYRMFKNPNVDEFQLFLMTSSSEVQALETKDREQITQLRAAIEAAMADS